MNAVTTGDAREHFAELINHVAYGKERIIVKRRNKSVAAMVPLEDLELIEALEDSIDLEEARHALMEAEKKGTVAWDEVKRRLKL